MQRWSPIALGALVVVVLAVLIVGKEGFRTSEKPAASSAPQAGPSAVASVAPSASGTVAAALPFGEGGTTGSLEDFGLGAMPSLDEPGGSTGTPLPQDAPKAVRFGVVLIQYSGAQGSPPNARSKGDALKLASELAETAKTDFRGAVQRGDSGSVEDAGRMPRGVLEPAAEYTLFTLPKGGVSGPIDTPRGFWIVRRLE